MTHGEQRLWLIQQLLNERNDAAGVQIPEDEQGQKDLLRGLMNIRMPDPIDDEFLRIQDEYLTEENLAEGVVKIEDLTPIKADNRLYIWQGDMSRLAVDAVTLPANVGCSKLIPLRVTATFKKSRNYGTLSWFSIMEKAA